MELEVATGYAVTECMMNFTHF